jgi:hypothetical protein
VGVLPDGKAFEDSGGFFGVGTLWIDPDLA